MKALDVAGTWDAMFVAHAYNKAAYARSAVEKRAMQSLCMHDYRQLLERNGGKRFMVYAGAVVLKLRSILKYSALPADMMKAQFCMQPLTHEQLNFDKSIIFNLHTRQIKQKKTEYRILLPRYQDSLS